MEPRYLGRRQVTHVILCRPCGSTDARAGAGGGLAGTKIQKEIRRLVEAGYECWRGMVGPATN